MPTKINGLPAHVLLVHLVIALIPLAGAALVASAVWPAARRRLGVVAPLLALAALVSVPITTQAGEWLRDHLANNIGRTNPAIRKHVELGDGLLPWALGIFVMSAVVWFLARRYDLAWRASAAPGSDGGAVGRTAARDGRRGAAQPDQPDGNRGGVATATAVAPGRGAALRRLPGWATALVAAVSVAVSVGGVVQLYRIGDSGAQAVWHGATSSGG